MRNLKLLYSAKTKFSKVKAELIAQHPFNEKLHFVYGDNVVKCLNTENLDVEELCCHAGVIGMEFVQLNECLCLATEDGEIIQYNLIDKESEVVGLISDGIETMSWSPDQELVVFVTK